MGLKLYRVRRAAHRWTISRVTCRCWWLRSPPIPPARAYSRNGLARVLKQWLSGLQSMGALYHYRNPPSNEDVTTITINQFHNNTILAAISLRRMYVFLNWRRNDQMFAPTLPTKFDTFDWVEPKRLITELDQKRLCPCVCIWLSVKVRQLFVIWECSSTLLSWYPTTY